MKRIFLFAVFTCFLLSPLYSETLQEYKARQAKAEKEFKKDQGKKLKNFKKDQAQKKKKFEQEQLENYKKYNKKKTKKQKEYDSYRHSTNENFAETMKKKWKNRIKNAAVPIPESKEPPKPYIKNDDKRTPAVKLGYTKVVNAASYEYPEPITPIDVGFSQSAIPSDFEQQYNFVYHGTTCRARFFDSMRFSLPDVSETSVAEVWKKLSSEEFDLLLADCFDLKEKLRLGDWGYIDIMRVMSEHFLGKGSNEAVLLQMYVLAQSGYKVRIAKTGDRLVLLVPFVTDLFSYSFFILDDGNSYYILDKEISNNQNRSYKIYEESFPREKTASLKMPGTPILVQEKGVDKVFQSRRYQDTFAEVVTNKNLIDFYNDYPVTVNGNWDDYVRTSLSEGIKNTLYPALRAQISGKSNLDAVNILMNFVQTAFQYMTDQEQFGYERPLFGDETFYYPYSDCEDRSILFAILVRELVGLDVVLLHYPSHLATAVNFGDEDVYGSYFNVDGKKYVVSDPTYIGAPVGECMTQFQNSVAEIIKL